MARKTEFSDLFEIASVMEVAGAFKGKSFSITGHLGAKRDDVVALIESGGGTFDKAPRYGTTYLITNADWNEGSTVREGSSRKLDAARQLGCKVISEGTFYQMIIDHSKKVAAESGGKGGW